jgi:hypothetical protein
MRLAEKLGWKGLTPVGFVDPCFHLRGDVYSLEAFID